MKIDLITGFLGAGKTTFLKKYIRYLKSLGEHICILENDHGAVNVDALLLYDILDDTVDLEAVAGGCDSDCHRRRFRTKLIQIAMMGCDRVIVEPSGVYDMDEFFDVLRDDPLDRMYEIGSVITIVDATLPEKLSDASEYVLATQAAHAGAIILSHTDLVSDFASKEASVLDHLNHALSSIGCDRRISTSELLDGQFLDKNFSAISNSGYKASDYVKRRVDEEDIFSTLYFMDHGLTCPDAKALVSELFSDPACGSIHRIKGFIPEGEGWYELNATKDAVSLLPCQKGQAVIIVIGENLNKDKIDQIFSSACARSSTIS